MVKAFIFVNLFSRPKKILIIQTAFLGDVVLATALVEKLAKSLPESSIDFLVRKGSESLLNNNPHLRKVRIFDKSGNKYLKLRNVIKGVRSEKYDLVVNVQRFLTTALITTLSAAGETVGFSKSPLSFRFTKRVPHNVTNGQHEVERNQKLIEEITDEQPAKPHVYPSESDYRAVQRFKAEPFITISPASVWFTKQFPFEKWLDFLNQLPKINVYILGSKKDNKIAEDLIARSTHTRIASLAGQLSLLQSAALMEGAIMNFTNDSAPMHLASAVNAPTTAIFCSTIPQFGFGPLADKSNIIQVEQKLECRPCGLHGRRKCPKKHFNCARNIDPARLIELIPATSS